MKKKEAAWQRANNLLETEPRGASCEHLLLYMLPLTLHYGQPDRFEGLIDKYNLRLKCSTDADHKDQAFLKAIRLVFIALTDLKNHRKIETQMEAIDWSALTGNPILQTFRFAIENDRQNRKAANKAIAYAVRAANCSYD